MRWRVPVSPLAVCPMMRVTMAISVVAQSSAIVVGKEEPPLLSVF